MVSGGCDPCSLRAVLRSLPCPGLYPWWILAVPEVRRAVGEGIPWEGSPRPPVTLPSHDSGLVLGMLGLAPEPRAPQPGHLLFPPSKDESGFAAPSLVSQGVGLVAVGYDIAPKGRCWPGGAVGAPASPVPS